ncbi:hypothetical protein AAEX63_11485 [Luteococcus sp. H138]|uniref:hypothetical protein n=1 Tax=unclassified Luteococcus TaxID=2639923 RepID=UPI00313DD2C0
MNTSGLSVFLRGCFSAFILAVIAIFPVPPAAQAAPNYAKVTVAAPPQEFEQAFAYYLTEDSGSPTGARFDSRRAYRQGASSDLMLAGRYYNGLVDSDPQTRMPEGYVRAAASIPIWGNWCGSGYGSGTPRDLLDAACMRHDKCYGSKGYWNCNCDRTLIAEINRDYSRMHLTEKIAANAVKAFFSARIKAAC